jgi:hypothetical protein
MAFAGHNVRHTWQPTHPRPIKYILVPLAMPVSVVLVSAALSEAIEPAVYKINGDATAAELAIMNFLLLKFELASIIKSSFLKYE